MCRCDEQPQQSRDKRNEGVLMKTDSVKDHDYGKFVEGVEARGFRVICSGCQDPTLESHDLSRIQQSVGMLQQAFKWMEQFGIEVPGAKGDEYLHSWDEILEQMDSGCDRLQSILNKVLNEELGCD
jgi:hypothetical protein